MTNWEEQNVNGEFWIGAHDAGVATRGTQGLDEEWLRDEAEMRRLIQHNELEGLIDPALNGL